MRETRLVSYGNFPKFKFRNPLAQNVHKVGRHIANSGRHSFIRQAELNNKDARDGRRSQSVDHLSEPAANLGHLAMVALPDF